MFYISLLNSCLNMANFYDIVFCKKNLVLLIKSKTDSSQLEIFLVPGILQNEGFSYYFIFNTQCTLNLNTP